jgi:demethylmenaquinone methyltransferase/2-methoxy-6-polyprenyl-1,4-benzoquinol methylase
LDQNHNFMGQIRRMNPIPSDFPLRDYYSDIHSTYDRVNRIFTFGCDRTWRRKAVAACLQSAPGSVLDLCTGTGDFILEVARQVGRNGRTAMLTGFDFSAAMLTEARRKLQKLRERERIPEVAFMEGDAGKMPFAECLFDAVGITFGIRNLLYENSSAERHLEELYRVLKPGGRLVILESSRPGNRWWRLFNNIYLQLIIPCLGGMISGSVKAYRYLAKSSRDYYTMTEMGSILEGAGFELLSSESLFLGSVMLVVAEK